jgi:hypothetical protein
VTLSSKRTRLLVIICLSVGLAVRLTIIARPIHVLVYRYLADDFFYYLSIAYNIAGGRGSTFDGGITRTNGYNPLFLWLLSLAFWVGATKVAAIRIGLIIQAISTLAAGWFVAQYCIRKRAPVAAVLSSGLLSFAPFFLWPTLTGFELALAAALALFSLDLWDRHAQPHWVGIACGVAFLARIDAMVIPFVLLLDSARRRQWRHGVVLGIGFLLVAVPFCAWSAHEFGLLLPGSAVQKTHLRSAASVETSIGTLLFTLPGILVTQRILDRVPSLVVWGLSAVVASFCLNGRRLLGGAREAITLVIIAAYVTLADGFEAGALKRYLFLPWVLLLASAALAIDRGDWWGGGRLVREFEPALRALAAVLILFVALSDCLLLVRWDAATSPAASFVGEASDLAPQLDHWVSGDERTASFDSGALGYFSTVPVVNLDGLVNEDIKRVHRECTGEYASCLTRYLAEKRVTTLVGCTTFSWTSLFPDWGTWTRLYESPALADGSRIVVLRLPAATGTDSPKR